MRLTSSAFQNNGLIPRKYTCEGGDVSPPLRIEFVPVMAKSLVLIVDDPDIPDFVKQKFHIEMWDHWILFNIPPNTKEIKEARPPPGTEGAGTMDRRHYSGPCPPDREHRYFFRLYALDSMLNLHEGAAKAEVIKAMEARLLEKAELVGRYEKKNK